MSDEDEAARLAEQRAREAAEAAVISNRISELHEEPIKGNFDVEHLKSIHAYIFNGYSEHRPGEVREGTGEGWIKDRLLEGHSNGYVVHYASEDIEAKITSTLDQFGGPEAIKGLTPDAAAGRLAELYGDLDHAHGFYEGNSRTLREFTRELAKEAEFNLDWTGTSVSAEQRNELYMARDLAVMERAFPDLTPEKAMQTNDRLEFEASFVIEALRNDVGERPLEAIIRDGLTPDIQLEQAQAPQVEPLQEASAEGIDAAPTAEALDVPTEAETVTTANTAEEIATDALDEVADVAGGIIEAIADLFESAIVGWTAPRAPAATQKPRTMQEFMEREQQQRAAAKQELAHSISASEAMTEEELLREKDAQQTRSRDGGRSI